MNIANKDNVTSTPTFFIHDKAGNTAVVQGAGNLERILPDLKDGVLGNDTIAPFDPQNGSAIAMSVGGKQSQR